MRGLFNAMINFISSRLVPETKTIRGGHFGGTLVLFNEAGDEVIVISALNRFMVHNMIHEVNANPEDDPGHAGVLSFGLMGSVESLPAGGLELETVIVFGRDFDEAWTRWGEVLMAYNKKTLWDNYEEDLATNYLSFWTNNGGFYYYHTMPGLNYEDTFIAMAEEFRQRKIPVRTLEIDSWWYEKDFGFAVKDWTTPLPEIFPNGLDYLAENTGLKIVAHNRYWSRFNIYKDYDFIKGSDSNLTFSTTV